MKLLSTLAFALFLTVSNSYAQLACPSARDLTMTGKDSLNESRLMKPIFDKIKTNVDVELTRNLSAFSKIKLISSVSNISLDTNYVSRFSVSLDYDWDVTFIGENVNANGSESFDLVFDQESRVDRFGRVQLGDCLVSYNRNVTVANTETAMTIKKIAVKGLVKFKPLELNKI